MDIDCEGALPECLYSCAASFSRGSYRHLQRYILGERVLRLVVHCIQPGTSCSVPMREPFAGRRRPSMSDIKVSTAEAGLFAQVASNIELNSPRSDSRYYDGSW